MIKPRFSIMSIVLSLLEQEHDILDRRHWLFSQIFDIKVSLFSILSNLQWFCEFKMIFSQQIKNHLIINLHIGTPYLVSFLIFLRSDPLKEIFQSIHHDTLCRLSKLDLMPPQQIFHVPSIRILRLICVRKCFILIFKILFVRLPKHCVRLPCSCLPISKHCTVYSIQSRMSHSFHCLFVDFFVWCFQVEAMIKLELEVILLSEAFYTLSVLVLNELSVRASSGQTVSRSRILEGQICLSKTFIFGLCGVWGLTLEAFESVVIQLVWTGVQIGTLVKETDSLVVHVSPKTVSICSGSCFVSWVGSIKAFRSIVSSWIAILRLAFILGVPASIVMGKLRVTDHSGLSSPVSWANTVESRTLVIALDGWESILLVVLNLRMIFDKPQGVFFLRHVRVTSSLVGIGYSIVVDRVIDFWDWPIV